MMRRAIKVFFKFTHHFFPAKLHGSICANSFVPEFWYVLCVCAFVLDLPAHRLLVCVGQVP